MASLGLEAIEAYKVWCRQHGFSAALSKTWQERRQERAAHQRDQQASQAEDAVRQHVAQLGLDGVAAYQTWCRQQGLGDAIHKSAAQRSKELKLHQQIQSTQALHKGRKHSRRTKDIIHQLWTGAIAEEELRTEVLRLIHRTFVGLAGDQRTQLRDLLLHVEKRASNLLDARPALHRLGRVDGNTFVEALGALARHSDAWQQSPSEWKPDSRNPRRQFAALVRFLLARYDVPTCLDSVWFGGWDQEAQRQQGWFVHVGSGQNIRMADLPLVLSKRMAHVFAEAPSELTATEALRWAQVMGQGGSEMLAQAVIATELGRSFADESFWSTVVLFFVENPMLDPDMVGPIVDYIAVLNDLRGFLIFSILLLRFRMLVLFSGVFSMVSDSSLSAFIASNPDARELKRALAVQMTLLGLKQGAIQAILGVQSSFISTWKKRYLTEGVACFRLGYKGSQPYLSADQRDQINAWLATQAQPSVAVLASYIQTQFGVVFRSSQSYYDILSQAGYSWKKDPSTAAQDRSPTGVGQTRRDKKN